ncbi:host attachment family protein [Bosea sp. 117]|uniref:baeRF12 domain-containing protein n=1 Tax=Bosea sp. 117 TaxID=1125973 RepID=UPI000494298D|nr:host attachment family protein [Bosea sp. 117]
MSGNNEKVRIEAGAWVAVCDGGKALILCNQGDAVFPNLRTIEVHEQENPATTEQGTDAPGRVHQSVGSSRSSVEPTDWHEEAERSFLRRLLDRLDSAVSSGAVRSLVIVAPPRALGIMRPLYSRAVRDALAAEIDRDLVKLPVYEIEKHLAA